MNLPLLNLTLFGGFELSIGENPQAFGDLDCYELLAFIACHGGRISRKIAAQTLWGHVCDPDEALRKALKGLREALTRDLPEPVREAARFRYLPIEQGFVTLAPDLYRSDLGKIRSTLKALDTLPREAQHAHLNQALRTYETSRLRGPLLQGYSWGWIEAARQSFEEEIRQAEREQRRADQDPNPSALPQVFEGKVCFDALPTEGAPRPASIGGPKKPLLSCGIGSSHNLPAPITSFIGRKQEREEVRELLENARFLTIIGAGGIGKTRLALQIALDELQEYPDGVWFADLAPLTDPALVPQTVAATVGVMVEPSTPLLASLIAALKPRKLLLVLDNCEHLTEACASLAETLLRACPGMSLLATSRAPLGITGEVTYSIPSLSLSDPRHFQTIETLSRSDAARLFLERATAARPTFQLTESNAPVVAEICRRLDGIPLALELAATHVRALSLEAISRRLDDRFRFLTGGSRTALPRHRTIRAAIDWSHDLLEEGERILLRRLSVFAGGWTLEAAEAVFQPEESGEDEILNQLSGLVEKSLVMYEEREGQERYRMLETVRAYARERLEECREAERTLNRHLDHFLAFAEGAESACRGPEQVEWLHRLESEHDNVRAALRWGWSNEAARERALRLTAAMAHFWQIRGPFQEARGWLERLMEALSNAPLPLARAAEGRAGVAPFHTPEAASFYEQAGDLYRRAGDAAGAARSLAFAAFHLECSPDITLILLAPARAAEALALARSQSDRYSLALVLCLAAHVPWSVPRRDLAEEAWEIALTLGNPYLTSLAAYTLGEQYQLEGDLFRYRDLLHESLSLLRALGDRAKSSMVLSEIASLDLKLATPREAVTEMEESLLLHRESGLAEPPLWQLWHLANALRAKGEVDPAREVLEECAVTSWGPFNVHWIHVNCQAQLAELARQRGDRQEAEARWKAACRLTREAQEGVRGACLGILEGVARDVGDYKQARAFSNERLALQRKIGVTSDTTALIAWLEGRGLLDSREGDHVRAIRLLNAAEAAATSRGLRFPTWIAEGDCRSIEAAAQNALGEAELSAARAVGPTLTLEEAVAYALVRESPTDRRQTAIYCSSQM